MINKLRKKNDESGQAVIMLLIVITVVALIFTHVALLNFSTLTTTAESSEGYKLESVAEGYLENAAIRYLRNPSYTGEAHNPDDDGYDCTIAVADLGGGLTDFKTTCSKMGRTKTVGMQSQYTAGSFTFTPMHTCRTSSSCE